MPADTKARLPLGSRHGLLMKASSRINLVSIPILPTGQDTSRTFVLLDISQQALAAFLTQEIKLINPISTSKETISAQAEISISSEFYLLRNDSRLLPHQTRQVQHPSSLHLLTGLSFLTSRTRIDHLRTGHIKAINHRLPMPLLLDHKTTGSLAFLSEPIKLRQKIQLRKPSTLKMSISSPLANGNIIRQIIRKISLRIAMLRKATTTQIMKDPRIQPMSTSYSHRRRRTIAATAVRPPSHLETSYFST